MKFMEASIVKEGTLFDVIVQRHGGGWLNCYFKNGIVYNGVGGKLVASVDVFSANWNVSSTSAKEQTSSNRKLGGKNVN